MYYDFSKKVSKKKKTKVKQPLDKKGKLYVLAAFIVLIISVVGGFGVAKLIQIANPDPEPEPELTPEQLESNLGVSFLKLESNNQNLVYSPLSIKNGLALLQSGAAGDTKEQIEQVLGDVVILKKTANIDDKLSLANAVFIRESFRDHISSDYVKKVKESYSAEVKFDDFTSSTKIDNWVNNNTLGLINRLGFTPKSDTRMVLINALGIKLDWVNQFNTSNTMGQTFFTADGKEIIVTAMSQKTNDVGVRYYQDNSISILALPFEKAGDAELEFVAIMPNNDLDNFIDSFDYDVLSAELNSLNSAATQKNGIEIIIPKFKFDYELKFKNDLMNLGIIDAFSSNAADFSAMADESIYVSDAIHKTNIDFSEDGIKASSVTASVISVGSALPTLSPKTIIKINRPFLFVIRDKNTGTVWFIGTVYQPNLWADESDEYNI